MAEPGGKEPFNTPLPAPDETEAETEGFEDSLFEQVRDLAENTRTAVEAELAWQGARAGYVGGRVARIAVWAGFALVCAFIAVLALAFGSILALTPIIGAAFATLVVAGVLLLAALIAGLVVRTRVVHLRAVAFSAKPGAPL